MKFTLNWLKEYLDTDASLDEISKKLTSIGLEVEGISDKSEALKEFKVAQIIDAKPHPDADKLRVCRVNTGEEELQIVCGAANARPGINVVLAPVGSIIPTNGMKIKASKIRGVESHGMLCSASELGIGEDGDGIIEMPACNDNISKHYASIAGLDDPVIEIAITPNRGDCLGVYGIARDLAASGLGKLKAPYSGKVKGEFKSSIKLTIEDKNACPLFIGRHFKGVKNGESPEWLKRRLEAIGLRPISALVDITNYIAFEFGRPLHVYDVKKLTGNLKVSLAKGGDKFSALDDREYILEKAMVVVTDDKNVQAIGGVIGGALSGCDENTDEVFLEVALFDPAAVAKAGRKLDIITDSRYRFERNVDPAFVEQGAEIASKMIIDLCGGEASELVIAGTEPKWQRAINFDFNRVSTLGGVDIKQAESEKILKILGFVVSGSKVEIPSWRSDIEGEADLVEEITRIYGYDNIPSAKLPIDNSNIKAVLTSVQKRASNVRRTLAAKGLYEAVTWSFMKGDKAKSFGFDNKALRLKNPISSDLDVMRPSIIPNLLDALGRNADRGFSDLGFFEIGLVFKGTDPQDQIQMATGVRSGKWIQRNVHGDARDVDVFDAKADLYAALKAAGAPVDNLQATTEALNWYHPGRSGVLRLGKQVLGVFGEIHPAILKEFDIKSKVVGFEVYLGSIPEAKAKKSKSRSKLEISEYQSSNRDFAFVVGEDVAVGEVLKSVAGVDKNLIREVSLFDVYRGKGVDDGKKSVAFSIRIQADDHTLTENELDGISSKIIDLLAKKYSGELRS